MGLVCVGCPVGSVRVVLHVTNLDVDVDSDAYGDEMAMVEFVAVFNTFVFISTFFQDVRVVLGATNLDVDGVTDADGFFSCIGYFGICLYIFQGCNSCIACDVDGDPDAD